MMTRNSDFSPEQEEHGLERMFIETARESRTYRSAGSEESAIFFYKHIASLERKINTLIIRKLINSQLK